MGMKKGDVSREVEDIGCLTWMDAFFFFFFFSFFSPRALIRLVATALFDRWWTIGGEIRESTVTNSFAKHASPSGHFARKFNMPGRARSIKPRCPPLSPLSCSRVKYFRPRRYHSLFLLVKGGRVEKKGWRGIVWRGIEDYSLLHSKKERRV